jgi:hypothetical protein
MYGYRLLALVFAICGIVAFVHFSNLQRQFEAKLHSIQAGEVQPETLTVISKRASHSQNGSSIRSLQSAQGWVVFRSSRQAELVYPAPNNRELYQTIKPGSTVSGYYFSDGYFIPQYDSDRDAGTAKWGFSSFCFLMGVLMLLFSFMFVRRRGNAT